MEDREWPKIKRSYRGVGGVADDKLGRVDSETLPERSGI